jgi:hypothetical protein
MRPRWIDRDLLAADPESRPSTDGWPPSWAGTLRVDSDAVVLATDLG